MKESIIQTAIEHLLKYLENQGKLVYIKNNSGALRTEKTFIRFGKAGSPDFFVFSAGGRCLHMEVKNEKGRQTDTQKAYQAMVEALGHEYVIVRSVEEAQIAVDKTKN